VTWLAKRAGSNLSAWDKNKASEGLRRFSSPYGRLALTVPVARSRVIAFFRSSSTVFSSDVVIAPDFTCAFNNASTWTVMRSR